MSGELIDIDSHVFLTDSERCLCQKIVDKGCSPVSAGKMLGLEADTVKKAMENPRVNNYIFELKRNAAEAAEITYEWKILKLKEIINIAMPQDISEIGMTGNLVIRAIEELNKMQGDYAAEKKLNVNASLNLSPCMLHVKEALEELKNKKEF